jgi:hypothetical protein
LFLAREDYGISLSVYGDEKNDAYDVSLSIWTNIYDILNKEIEERNEYK